MNNKLITIKSCRLHKAQAGTATLRCAAPYSGRYISRRSMKHLLILILAFSIFGCAANQKKSISKSNNGDDCSIPELTGKSCVEPNYEEISKHPFGVSGHNPVRVDGPRGQRDYLSRLICPDSRVVSGFSRGGSVGIGPYGFMMDVYEVECGDKTYLIYMDMYHTGRIEDKPVEGFTIKH